MQEKHLLNVNLEKMLTDSSKWQNWLHNLGDPVPNENAVALVKTLLRISRWWQPSSKPSMRPSSEPDALQLHALHTQQAGPGYGPSCYCCGDSVGGVAPRPPRMGCLAFLPEAWRSGQEPHSLMWPSCAQLSPPSPPQTKRPGENLKLEKGQNGPCQVGQALSVPHSKRLIYTWLVFVAVPGSAKVLQMCAKQKCKWVSIMHVHIMYGFYCTW